MKQKHAVILLFALIIVSGITSFSSYQATERMITEDMKSALTKTLAEQQSDVIRTVAWKCYTGCDNQTRWSSL